MASSWGDERTTFRFRSSEIWLDLSEVEVMADETRKLVEKLEQVRTPAPGVRLSGLPEVQPVPA